MTARRAPGYYWLRSRSTGRWIVGRYDSGDRLQWTFIGSLHLCDDDELLAIESEEGETYELGPKIESPEPE